MRCNSSTCPFAGADPSQFRHRRLTRKSPGRIAPDESLERDLKNSIKAWVRVPMSISGLVYQIGFCLPMIGRANFRRRLRSRKICHFNVSGFCLHECECGRILSLASTPASGSVPGRPHKMRAVYWLL